MEVYPWQVALSPAGGTLPTGIYVHTSPAALTLDFFRGISELLLERFEGSISGMDSDTATLNTTNRDKEE